MQRVISEKKTKIIQIKTCWRIGSKEEVVRDSRRRRRRIDGGMLFLPFPTDGVLFH